MAVLLIFLGVLEDFSKVILCPLFLFDIVMEALSRMLGAATATGQFSGFTVGNEAGSLMSVSHLLFADDTLVFCDADSTHITALRGILSR